MQRICVAILVRQLIIAISAKFCLMNFAVRKVNVRMASNRPLNLSTISNASRVRRNAIPVKILLFALIVRLVMPLINLEYANSVASTLRIVIAVNLINSMINSYV